SQLLGNGNWTLASGASCGEFTRLGAFRSVRMRIPSVRSVLVAAAVAATGLAGAVASTPVLASTAAAVTHGPVAAHAVAPRLINHHWNSTSTNWAGYAVAGSRYTSVSASWTQPAVSCTSTNTWSSFWVGLDGYNSG